jgi:hypothetical protein
VVVRPGIGGGWTITDNRWWNRTGTESLMDVPGIGPAGQASHDFELPQEAADHLVGVLLCGKLFQLGQDARQRRLDRRDRALRIVLTLLLEAVLQLEKLFTIKIGADGRKV